MQLEVYNSCVGGRVCGSAEHPSEDNRTEGRALVGAGAEWPGTLLSLSASLPHESRTSWFLFYPHQSRWKTLQFGLWRACRATSRSHREETSQPFFAGNARLQHGNGRMQHGMFLLPELGHF